MRAKYLAKTRFRKFVICIGAHVSRTMRFVESAYRTIDEAHPRPVTEERKLRRAYRRSLFLGVCSVQP